MQHTLLWVGCRVCHKCRTTLENLFFHNKLHKKPKATTAAIVFVEQPTIELLPLCHRNQLDLLNPNKPTSVAPLQECL